MRWRSSFFFFAVAGLMACFAITAQAAVVNYWNFDSDGSDSVAGGSGTFIGDATITSVSGEYVVGTGALKVAHNTSTGDYFDVDYDVIPDHGVYTVTGWYKWDDSFSSQAIDGRGFLYETTPSWSSGVGVYTSDYLTAFWADGVSSDIGANKFSSGAINDAAWHFFAITYDAVNDEAAYYHDGGVTSFTSAPEIVASTGLHIGNHRGGDGGRNWQGYVDDFAVYEGIISETDVYNLYSGVYTPLTVPVDDSNVPDPAPPIPTGRPVAYWNFDSGYSSTVNNDLYQGTAHGDYYTSIDTTTGVPARGAGALRLDSGSASGNGTYVAVGEEVGTGVIDSETHKQVSITSWFRAEDLSSDGSDSRMMVYETTPDYSVSLGVRANTAGENWCQWYTNTDTGAYFGRYGPEVESGQWCHVVTNYDLEAGRMQFYFNGELLYDQAFDAESFDANTGFIIGNHRTGDGSRDFDGYIDDVAIYHGVMTPEAVAGLYAGTYTPTNVPVADNLAAFTNTATLADPAYSQDLTGSFEAPAGLSYCASDNSLVIASRSNGGIYKIATDGTATPLVESVTSVAATAVNPANGDLFFVSDVAGVVQRVAAGTTTVEDWATGFHSDGGDTSGDDDGCSMVIVPATYTGGLVTPGSLLMVDRGSGGFEEIWSISTTTAETYSALVSDADAADGIGNVLFDPTGIAVTDTQIFVSDLGASKIYEVTAQDTLVEFLDFDYGKTIFSMIADPSTGDLITLNAVGQVHRIDTLTGDMELLLTLEEKSAENWLFNELTISDDGSQLAVGSYDMDLIYSFSLASPPVAGDANNDGMVDGSDVTILANNWQYGVGMTNPDATWSMGDFNGDGMVDGSDVTILANNWQYGVSSSAASVPEPSVLVLLAGLILTAVWFKRR